MPQRPPPLPAEGLLGGSPHGPSAGSRRGQNLSVAGELCPFQAHCSISPVVRRKGTGDGSSPVLALKQARDVGAPRVPPIFDAITRGTTLNTLTISSNAIEPE